MYKIYLFDRYDDISDELLERMIRSLPEERRKKALSYHFRRDRMNCVISYMLLYYALRYDFGERELPVWNTAEEGKPSLDKEGLYFNISHCRKACVCVVGDREVGVDVQDICEADLDVMKYAFTEEEIRSVETSEDPDREFTRIWTCKESFLKMTGEGIGDGLAKVDSLASDKKYRSIRRGETIITIIEKNQ